MQAFWIIGYGKVGRRALERLQRKYAEAVFTVVDPRLGDNPDEAGSVRWIQGDGVRFLLDRLPETDGGDSPWIVPAVPFHLAYEWLAARLGESGTVTASAVPEKLGRELPNAFIGPEGQVFISLADFICPANCIEPRKKCPATGKPRPYELYDHLSGLSSGDYRPLVIRSHQLAPGVGGYRGAQLKDALDQVRRQPGDYLMSTASKCHGVMHAFGYQRSDFLDS